MQAGGRASSNPVSRSGVRARENAAMQFPHPEDPTAPSAPPRMRPALVLGSTSRYRREMLGRLRQPFEVVAPEVDESPRDGEAPRELAQRLARAKAQAVAQRHPTACVIGSDQVLDLDGQCLGKPLTHERARAQLRALSGRTVVFHTAVCVIRADTGFDEVVNVPVEVVFRALDAHSIEHYLLTEQPYDCAGSARSEALGIALLDAVRCDDPTALVGLPLIATCRLLRAAGLEVLA